MDRGAHIYILPCLNLRQRSDRRYFQLNARNDPEGWIGGIDTTVHSRNECSVHFESSILVSIILRTTLAACTLVLPVIIRTSVSKGGGGGGSVGGSREEQTTSGNTCNDPVFDIGSGAFRCTSPSSVAFNLFHLPSLNKRSVLTGFHLRWVLRDSRRLSILVDRLSFEGTFFFSKKKKKKKYISKGVD